MKLLGIDSTTLLIGAGALLLLSRTSSGRVKLNKEDYKFLNQDRRKELQRMIKEDTSPVFYTSKGNRQRTDQETSELLNKLKKRYIDDAEIGQLSFPSNILSDAILALLDLENVTVREQTMDMFLKMFDAYNKIFSSTVQATCLGVAAITEAAGVNIRNAKECTEWTWAKKTSDSVDQDSNTATLIGTSHSSTKVLLGIMGSGSSTTTMHATITSDSLREKKEISFIPHCTSTQIDIGAVEAILISQGAALKSVYDPLRAVIKMAPTLKAS